MSERIFIIDIDGCVLKNIYPNFNEYRITLEEVKNRLLKVNLYTQFYDFLHYVINPELDIIYFLTGRKKSELGYITKLQLSKLQDMQIKYFITFYPDNLEIIERFYFHFKIVNCNNHISFNKDKKIIIIDDKDDYFDLIEKRDNVYCFKVNDKHSWHELIKKEF